MPYSPVKSEIKTASMAMPSIMITIDSMDDNSPSIIKTKWL
jgi:hypothetical protein